MQLVHAVRDLELTSGGPSRSIPELVKSIDIASSALDWRQHLIFGDRGKPNADVEIGPRLQAHGIRYRSLPTAINGLTYCINGIHVSQPISIVHVHGLWSPALHQVVRWCRSRGIPYVVSPQGMLSEWCLNYKWLKKRIGWYFYQRYDLKLAAAIHVTSDDEQNHVRRMGLTVPTFIVSNVMPVCARPRTHSLAGETRLAVCITRLHPVKGLDLLIEAWLKLQPAHWRLVIAGPSEVGTRDRLAAQIKASPASRSIELCGEVNGSDKQNLLDKAELFVLPSYSENFGMAIAESLALGIPVVTTFGTPWSAIVPNRCGWFVAPRVQDLQQALYDATQCTTDTLLEMGSRGRALIANECSPEAVSRGMMAAYLSILAANDSDNTNHRVSYDTRRWSGFFTSCLQ